MNSKIQKAIDLFGNLIPSNEIICIIRDTDRDLSVYGQTDGLTDDLVKAGRKNGLEIFSSPFSRSNGFTHFIKYSNFEQTKKIMESIESLPFKIKVTHLNKGGIEIWPCMVLIQMP